MQRLRILLADDHTLVRSGIRALLSKLEHVQIVAETGDGQDALRLIQAEQPDIALIDIAMPGLNGLDATARAAKEYPNVKVIILSMHANEEYVLRALRVGAVGYLLKDASATELEIAINAVAQGQTYLSPAISRHVVADYVRRVGNQNEIDERTRLTPRQREILQLIAEGNTTQEIANQLNISVKTVETHRAQLMERLDIHDVAGLVRYAIRIGMVRDL